MRLLELRLVNFKSVRDATLTFEPFTCLIGPNNSGKTNLLEGLAFLQQAFRHEFQDVANRYGGWERLRNYAAQPDEPITFELRVHMDGPRPRVLEYVLSINARGRLERELLRDITVTPAVEVVKVVREAGGTTYSFVDATGKENTHTGGGHFTESYVRSLPQSPLASEFTKYVAGWRFYRFSPDNLKARGPAEETSELSRDGSNFASYVHALQSRHRRVFHRIETQLTKSFPEIEELASPLIGQQTVISVKEKWFDTHAEGAQLSDGLVGYLAHLVAFHATPPPTLLVFEEPENYVHARLMERLVEMMRGAFEETQTVVTTHSVTLLNLLDLRDIRLVKREQGATTVDSFEHNEALKEALKSYALGDAYFSGELGGVPE